LVLTSGNLVGVGTASPACPLDTNGMIRAISKAGAYPASGKGLEIYYESSVDSAYLLSYDRGASAYKPLVYGGLTHTFTVSGYLGMTLDSSGRLGIGNSSPQFFLEVDQNSATTTPNKNSAIQVYTRGYNGSNTYYGGIGFAMHEHTNGYWGCGIQAVDDTGNYGAGLAFSTSTGSATPTSTERMRLDSGGNLLVGITGSAGGSSNTAKAVAGAFITTTGTTSSLASGSATNFYTTQNNGAYLIHIKGNSDAGYAGVWIVWATNGGIQQVKIGGQPTLSLEQGAANTIALRSTGAPTQTYNYSAISFGDIS